MWLIDDEGSSRSARPETRPDIAMTCCADVVMQPHSTAASTAGCEPPQPNFNLQREGLGFWGPLAMYGRTQHRREISLQVDSELAFGWRHDDGVDEPSVASVRVSGCSRADEASTSRSSIALLSRSDHNAAAHSRMNRYVPHQCDGQPEGHHVQPSRRRSHGSVKPDSPEGDGATRSGLTGPRTAGQSRVVMAAVYATLAHVSELARPSRRAGGR